ncbi:MAG: hypothetical protein RLY86_2217 [Pseudomonadota bacterium]|jgi:RND family efflux transporter MFP subunit
MDSLSTAVTTGPTETTGADAGTFTQVPPRTRAAALGGAVISGLKRWRRLTVPVGILLTAVAGCAVLNATAPEVQREAKPERSWAVDVVATRRADHQPRIQALGTVAAGRSVDLRPLVAGTVEQVAPVLNDGGVVRAGELLMTIEPLDYELQVAETRALLDEARARLDEFRANVIAESQQLELRRRELTRNEELFRRGAVAAPRLEQSQLAVQQMEQGFTASEARVRQQQAVVDRLTAALTKAETDLQRTRLVAPFDGFIGSVAVEEGMRVGPGDRVAVLSGAAGLEVLVTLPTETYGRLAADSQGLIGRPAEVVWALGSSQFSYPAHVERVIDRIDTRTGGVGIFVRLDGNFLAEALRPGAFVSVNLPDRVYAGVVQLPPTALHGDDRVYVVNGEERLEARIVEVLSRDGGSVYIGAGLTDGDKVVTTRFQEIAGGVKVAIRGTGTSENEPAAQSAEAPPAAGPGEAGATAGDDTQTGKEDGQ